MQYIAHVTRVLRVMCTKLFVHNVLLLLLLGPSLSAIEFYMSDDWYIVDVVFTWFIEFAGQ